MRPMAGELLALAIALIEFGGALIVAAYCTVAATVLLRERQPSHARQLVATGALMGLNFKLAATLLKTLFVTSWSQVGLLAFVLVLRTALKWAFAREHGGPPEA